MDNINCFNIIYNYKENDISNYSYLFNDYKYRLLFIKNDSHVMVLLLSSFLNNSNDLNSCIKNYINYINKNYFDNEHIWNKIKQNIFIFRNMKKELIMIKNIKSLI